MSTSAPIDPKPLYRRLDALFGAVDGARPQRRLLEAFLEEAFNALRDDLRLRAALLYGERRDGFALLKELGAAGGAVADTLDPGSPALARVFEHRVYIFPDPDGEGAPHRLGLLPRAPAAALVVGRRPARQVFFFLMHEGYALDELDFTLNTLRVALGTRLADERVRGRFKEAALIQQSLLLEEPPAFPGYEIACRSLAAEEVGGDFYDFYPLGSAALGFSIGDASGHGLPAALQVRDVVTGLRMGMERHLDAAYVFRKLNQVIHRSNLSSRFVSVFYGELEASGDLVYVNAGHPPALLVSAAGVRELPASGTVIGPLAEAEFRRGFARLEPGDTLLLTTDGILERRGAGGEFFGTEGVLAAAGAAVRRPAAEQLDRVVEAALEHGRRAPWEDDATVVVIRRTPSGERAPTAAPAAP